MQSVSSRIWTRVAVSISCDDNHYTTGTSIKVMNSYGPPHMAEQKQDDQHEHTFSNYVRIRDVVQKTCQRRWMIGKSGERGSGISVLPARYDDDDEYYCGSMWPPVWEPRFFFLFRDAVLIFDWKYWLFLLKLDIYCRPSGW